MTTKITKGLEYDNESESTWVYPKRETRIMQKIAQQQGFGSQSISASFGLYFDNLERSGSNLLPEY